MRKRTISARLKKPLLLTALDRRKAGVLPEGLKKKKSVKRARPRRARLPEILQEIPLETYRPRRGLKPRRSPTAKSRSRAAKPAETFSAPLLDFYAEPAVSYAETIVEEPAPPAKKQKRSQKKIGAITHYYDRIQVAVIKLAGTLSVGDCISYETANGPYEQIVESMEINREPVFKAGRGKEIGLKLRRIPRVGCAVHSI